MLIGACFCHSGVFRNVSWLVCFEGTSRAVLASGKRPGPVATLTQCAVCLCTRCAGCPGGTWPCCASSAGTAAWIGAAALWWHFLVHLAHFRPGFNLEGTDNSLLRHRRLRTISGWLRLERPGALILLPGPLMMFMGHLYLGCLAGCHLNLANCG